MYVCLIYSNPYFSLQMKPFCTCSTEDLPNMSDGEDSDETSEETQEDEGIADLSEEDTDPNKHM